MSIAKAGLDGKDMVIKVKPLVGGGTWFEHRISRQDDSEWPVSFNTATSPELKDFIGNVVAIYDGKCTVKGVYRGKIQEVRNIRICSDDIKKVKDRVMVTEHMDVSGRLDFIATKKRVLFDTCHWVNVGWSNEKRCRHLRVDLYTGDCREVTCASNTSFFIGRK